MCKVYVSYNYIVQFNLYVYLEHLKIIVVVENLTDFIRDTHILKKHFKKGNSNNYSRMIFDSDALLYAPYFRYLVRFSMKRDGSPRIHSESTTIYYMTKSVYA